MNPEENLDFTRETVVGYFHAVMNCGYGYSLPYLLMR